MLSREKHRVNSRERREEHMFFMRKAHIRATAWLKTGQDLWI